MREQGTGNRVQEAVANALSPATYHLQPTSCRAMRGMTLIDVIVGVALMLMVFLSLFAAFKLSIDLVHNTKAKAGAIALMTAKMEYVRGLPYENVGTVGGIPAGPLEQLEQQTLNGITYTVRTLIQYVDAPEDGLGGSDTNGITADYKSVKIETLWIIRGQSRSTLAVTRVSPHGIESLTSGGTLRVNVFDAVAAPLVGASVRIQNSTTNPLIDITVSTDVSGSVAFPGAPASAGYKITATKSGYSTAQTYDATVGNPSPNPGHAAVSNQQTTTLSLAIDLLGSLQVITLDPPGTGTFDDTFSNEALLMATSSSEVTNGALVLSGATGSYAALGTARSINIAPSYLSQWAHVSWMASTTGPVAVAMQVYAWDGAQYALISDADLPGNAVGYASSPIDLSALSAASYPSIVLGTALSSGDPLYTPELNDWHVSYVAGPTPHANVDFSIEGAKTIGSSPTGVPLYKVDEAYTTDSSGQWLMSALEWDLYTISLSGSGYDIVEQCPNYVSLSPAENKQVSITIADHTTNSLRVYVTGNGSLVAGASVSVVGGAVNTVQPTSACGQIFLGGIASNTYTVTVTAPGYVPYVENVAVNGTTVATVVLVPN